MKIRKVEIKKWYVWIIFGALVVLPFLFYKQILFLSSILSNYILAIFVAIFSFMIILPILSMVKLIKYKDTDDFNKDLKLYLSFITILLLFLQALILSNQKEIMQQQTEISNKQTEILDRTTQSNKADLTLVFSEGYRYYAYRIEDLDEKREIEQLPLGIINSGKLIAPFIKVKLIPEQFISKMNSSPWEIKNLESLGYSSTAFYFGSIYSNISVGEYNITFSVSCPYCEEGYKKESITICVYSEYGKAFEECGKKEKWRDGGLN